MEFKRRWGFGFGTIFSMIVVYFIYLYSKTQGWTLLAFISKWYLIIVGGLLLLSVAIILLVLLLSLILITAAAIKMSRLKRKYRKQKSSHVDVEYKVKE